jgi:hypothetical protein
MNHHDPRRSSGLKKPSGTVERRKSERIPFSAVAQLVEPRSQTRLAARVADISHHGCYVDALNAMPVGTKVIITIEHSSSQLKTDASITYSMPGMGMGLSFQNLSFESKSLLGRWIAEARGEVFSPSKAVQAEATPALPKPPRDEKQILSRLIGLMVRKDLLTQSEGTDLLGEVLDEE